MARTLFFKIKGREFPVIPNKLERRKLYGWTELVVTDTTGHRCRQAAINSDGVTIVDQGATKAGIISDDGLWIDRSELIAIDEKGNEIHPAESSFDTGCCLEVAASVDEVLNLNVTAVYHISMENDTLLRGVIGDSIYKFPFNYRAGFSRADAFILANNAGIFMLTGTPASVEFIGLEETGIIDDGEDFEIDDDLDFGMM